MTLRIQTPAAVLAITAALAGCTAQPDVQDSFGFGEEDSDTDDMMGRDGADGADGADGGDGADDGADGGDAGEPAAEVPHAHGTVMLGESHPPGGGQPTPIVTASFVPDSEAMPGSCGTEVAGCFVSTVPDCGEAGCGLDEVCSFDGNCQASCQAICDLACAEGEQCYFPVPGSPACRVRETFDAGALTFSGTTVPVTLFPPYEFVGQVTGALAVPGNEITVNASGATGTAGFEAFEHTFTATSPLVSQIASLTIEQAYGAGPMPLRWTPGDDAMRVSLTISGTAGGYGIVTCEADDTGSFDVPRAAITAAVPGEEPSSIFVDLTRHSTAIYKDVATRGSLLEATVRSEAWVELVSSSSESTMIAGCGGLAFCGNECVDVSYDELNCGGCNIVCGASQTCSAGTCVDSGTTGGGGGACCTTSAGPGCADAAIEACVCASDSYCCSTAWDSACVGEVTSLGCGTC